MLTMICHDMLCYECMLLCMHACLRFRFFGLSSIQMATPDSESLPDLVGSSSDSAPEEMAQKKQKLSEDAKPKLSEDAKPTFHLMVPDWMQAFPLICLSFSPPFPLPFLSFSFPSPLVFLRCSSAFPLRSSAFPLSFCVVPLIFLRVCSPFPLFLPLLFRFFSAAVPLRFLFLSSAFPVLFFSFSLPSALKKVLFQDLQPDYGRGITREIMRNALQVLAEFKQGLHFQEVGDVVFLETFHVYKKPGSGAFSVDLMLIMKSTTTLEFHAEQGIVGA